MRLHGEPLLEERRKKLKTNFRRKTTVGFIFTCIYLTVMFYGWYTYQFGSLTDLGDEKVIFWLAIAPTIMFLYPFTKCTSSVILMMTIYNMAFPYDWHLLLHPIVLNLWILCYNYFAVSDEIFSNIFFVSSSYLISCRGSYLKQFKSSILIGHIGWVYFILILIMDLVTTACIVKYVPNVSKKYKFVMVPKLINYFVLIMINHTFSNQVCLYWISFVVIPLYFLGYNPVFIAIKNRKEPEVNEAASVFYIARRVDVTKDHTPLFRRCLQRMFKNCESSRHTKKRN